MRIVDRKTFLAMPANTVFSKYQRINFGSLMIKGKTIGQDFYLQQIEDAIASRSDVEFFDLLENALATGHSLAMDFHAEGRDRLFDPEQMFAVWEPADVAALIARLQQCMTPEKG